MRRLFGRVSVGFVVDGLLRGTILDLGGGVAFAEKGWASSLVGVGDDGARGVAGFVAVAPGVTIEAVLNDFSTCFSRSSVLRPGSLSAAFRLAVLGDVGVVDLLASGRSSVGKAYGSRVAGGRLSFGFGCEEAGGGTMTDGFGFREGPDSTLGGKSSSPPSFLRKPFASVGPGICLSARVETAGRLDAASLAETCEKSYGSAAARADCRGCMVGLVRVALVGGSGGSMVGLDAGRETGTARDVVASVAAGLVERRAE